MRESYDRQRGYPRADAPEPTTASFASPTAMADGSVVLFVDTVGEFGTSLQTMAWLDPVHLTWSEPISLPDYVAMTSRPTVSLADGRLVTTGWSEAAHASRLFTWSPAEGWREGPALEPASLTPMALLPDGRVLFVERGEKELILTRV